MTLRVSIHAPTRGATLLFFSILHVLSRFQSTRPRGARLSSAMQARRLKSVSIHAPTRGATPIMTAPAGGYNAVSIHAPTRGATVPSYCKFQHHQGFNPRAHAGRDLCFWLTITEPGAFQSTRPRGARPVFFNLPFAQFPVSIHAPTRGATMMRKSRGCRLKSVSIHAPTRGATSGFKLDREQSDVSIHAPTRGATWSTSRNGAEREFQSTRPRGARRRVVTGQVQFTDVSIHAPTRGATSDQQQTTSARSVSIHAPTRGATRTASA